MGRAKDIRVEPISATDARKIIKSLHYSGTVVQNSQLHFGVFLGGRCGGALQFGPSLNKYKTIGMVGGTKWNGFIELNRMALAEWLPRNGESRALSVCLRLIRKAYSHIGWVVSFSDATRSGDGTIYRASGFLLTAIKKNDKTLLLPSGKVVSAYTLVAHAVGAARVTAETRSELNMGPVRGTTSIREYLDAGAKLLPGFQLRYIYFLDPEARQRLAVPVIPFSEIAKRGASMYRGKPSVKSDTSDTPGLPARRGRGSTDLDAPILEKAVLDG